MRCGLRPKTIAALLLLSGVVCAPALAETELTPWAGYRFAGAFTDKTSDGRIELEADVSGGLFIDVAVKDGFVEVMLSRQETVIKPKESGSSAPTVPAYVDYFQVGGLYDWRDKPLKPFANVLLGATRWEPKDSSLDSEWAFAFTIGGGLKYYFSKRVGLRWGLQLLGSAWGGSRLFCEDQPNCIDMKGTVVLQGETMLGVTFVLGRP